MDASLILLLLFLCKEILFGIHLTLENQMLFPIGLCTNFWVFFFLELVVNLDLLLETCIICLKVSQFVFDVLNFNIRSTRGVLTCLDTIMFEHLFGSFVSLAFLTAIEEFHEVLEVHIKNCSLLN